MLQHNSAWHLKTVAGLPDGHHPRRGLFAIYTLP